LITSKERAPVLQLTWGRMLGWTSFGYNRERELRCWNQEKNKKEGGALGRGKGWAETPHWGGEGSQEKALLRSIGTNIVEISSPLKKNPEGPKRSKRGIGNRKNRVLNIDTAAFLGSKTGLRLASRT